MSQNSAFSAQTLSLLGSESQDDTTVTEDASLHSRLALRRSELLLEIQAVNWKQNSLTWTYRLPHEILSCIFLLVQLQTSGVTSSKRCRLSWLGRITHVCAHWRRVALAGTTLWSTLDFAHPPFARMMLQRSRSSVLNLNFHRRDYTSRAALEASAVAFTEVLTTQAELLRSVDVDVEGTTLEVGLSILSSLSGWTVPAARLKHLDITVSLEQQQTKSKSSNLELSPFISNGAPALQHLSLIRWSVPFDTLSFSQNMKFLCPEQDTKCVSARVRAGSMQSLVLALQTIPLLQDLSLTNYLPMVTDIKRTAASHPPPPPRQLLVMPSLMHLKVHDTHMTRTLKAFLGSLTFCDAQICSLSA